ncbi:hypothetical protein HPB48_004107 [Haemaphysalis longicornis]|uniref:Uncharacterized protein n=1 Tax=Haemaphysalis longicornis TaxID=44386 RepID=A0A9J6FC82_HAELO|nr:hypothetical protein HPB48_004107 [Haemaphysalis longicornis]
MTQKMAEFLQMFSASSSGFPIPPAGVASSLNSLGLAAAAPSSTTSAHLAPLPPTNALLGTPGGFEQPPHAHMSSPSNDEAAANEVGGQFPLHPDMPSARVEDSEEMEVGQSTPLAQKRRLSPTSEEASKVPKPKNNKNNENTKKSTQSTNQPHDILQQAISSAQLG